MKGTKGWFVGGAYAPIDNVGLMAKYFNGKYITGGVDVVFSLPTPKSLA
jgi:hypothetical protein